MRASGSRAFTLFDAQHLLTIAALVTAIAAMCAVGRRVEGTRAERGYAIALSACVWLLWLGYQTYDITTRGFDPRYSLPLHVSDLTAAVASFVFVWPRRRLQALAYFWGLALGSQAVLTPDLTAGPSTLAFWAFWIYHLLVVGGGVYVVVVQGFRPTWYDLRFAILAGIVFVAVVFTIDAVFSLNYAYLGRGMPSQPSLLNLLGPWPLRVVFMVLLGSAAMTVLLLPWLVRRRDLS